MGAVFSIIAITSTVGYVTYSMHLLDSYAQTFLTQNQQRSDMQKEQFKVSSISLAGNKFNITVQNTGQIPINITRLWVQNTTTTNWVAKYQADYLVPPAQTVSNIGVTLPLSALPTAAYDVKLITDRGNSQDVTVNSPNTVPLNLQLMALPPTVASGFKTDLVMIVTNNSTGTMINVSPQTPTLISYNATTCNLGSVSPTKINTLPSGSTAVFVWPVTATGQGNTNCTYQAQLQNGYPGQTVQATITVSVVPVSTSSITSAISTVSGVITMNYSSFHWTQGGQWNSGWQIPDNSKDTAFAITVTNNNATGDFYISQQSYFWLATTYNGNNANKNFAYIINSTNLSPFQINKYSCRAIDDYCVKVQHGGGTITIYFGDQGPESGSPVSFSAGPYDCFILMFGKFATSQTASGSAYGQNIPYTAVLVQ